MQTGKSLRKYVATALSLLFLFSSGCAVVTPISPSELHALRPQLNADSCIKLRELRFTGAFGNLEAKPGPFLSAFSKRVAEIKCVASPEYAEGTLAVVIDTDYRLNRASYPGMAPLPFIGVCMLVGAGGYTYYDWRVNVTYELKDRQDRLIARNTIPINGTHADEPGVGDGCMAAMVGAWFIPLLYPSEKAKTGFADQILTIAGQEVAKRMREEPACLYFTAQTRARDGMDLKTYAAFLRRDEQLRQNREQLAADHRKGLQGTVEDESSTVRLGGTLVMLGIGVDQYANFPHLQYASRDCERMVSLFKTRYNLPDSHVLILTNQEATAAKVKRFIEQDAAKLLKEDDTFILYFGGHGAPDVDAASTKEDGMRKYLLLSNSDPQTMPLSAVSLDDLANLMRKLPCKRVLVFLDCCFAGTAGKDTLSRLRGLRISEQTYKDMTEISGKGRVVMAACNENQVSQESSALKAGMFTQALVEGLDGKADRDGNGRVDILELFNYSTRRVGELTNGAQTPVFRGSLDRKIEF